MRLDLSPFWAYLDELPAWPRIAGVLVFLLGSLGAVIAGLDSARENDQRQHESFRHRASEVSGELLHRMDIYAAGLKSIRAAALGAGSQHFGRVEFDHAVSAMRLDTEFPGSRGLSFVRRDRTGEADRWLVRFIAPFATNAKAIGFDIGSEGRRRRAIEQAVLSNQVTITEPVTLVQTPIPDHGFLLLLPVYQEGKDISVPERRREHAVGLASMPILIDEVLDSFSVHDESFALQLQARRLDGSMVTFYRSPGMSQVRPGQLSESLKLSVYGQEWVATFHATPYFLRSLNLGNPFSLTLTLMLLSLLTAVLIYTYLIYRVGERREGINRARLARLVDNAVDAIISTDMRGRVTTWNDAAADIFGYSASQVMGRPLYALIAPTGLEHEILDRLKILGQGGSVRPFESVRRHRDGHLIPVSITVSSLADARGRAVAAFAILRDISEQKAARARIEQLNQSLEAQVQSRTAELRRVADLLNNVLQAASEIAIIATAVDGNIEVFNSGAERLLKYRAEEVVGRCQPVIFHDPDEVAARAAVLSEQHGYDINGLDVFTHEPLRLGVERGEWTYVTAEGDRVRVSLVITPRRSASGELDGFVGVAQDMTQRLQVEQALKDAKQAAEAANEAKSIFLANMSHEIRTPLNGMLGLCQLLLRESHPAATQDMLVKIRGAGQSLLAIINDILDFSKIEASHLVLEEAPFCLGELLEDLQDVLQGAIGDKPVSLAIGAPPPAAEWLVGDALRVSQILLNLLGNAVKFTEQGRVGLEIRLQTSRSPQLVFEVSDTGIGMSPEQMEHIFEAFNQADNTISRSFGGTGLGLSISRELTRLMGGSLKASSKLGEGSVFTLTIPFRPLDQVPQTPSIALPAAPAPGREQRPRLEGSRILVVDDSELNREVLDSLLTAEGAMVAQACQGEEALSWLQAHVADLVLMDIQMPVMDGYTATRAIRQQPLLRGLPVFAVTAGVLDSQREQALAAGMNGVFAKPFDVDVLVDSLAEGLRQQRYLGIFVREYSDILPRLVEGEKVQRQLLLHRLKGAAGMIGLTAVAQAAEQWERVLMDDGNVQSCEDLLAAALEHVWMTLPPALAQARPQPHHKCFVAPKDALG